MANRDVMVNGKRYPRVRVQHRALLYVAMVTDVDAGVVTPNADIGPNAGLSTYDYVADQIGRVKNKGCWVNARDKVAELINRHDGLRLIRGKADSLA